jgi:DNA-binding IclR family transcriptional regulator
LKALYAQQSKEITAAGLGDSWAAFKKSLLALRRSGVCVTESEIDVGRVGIAAPIFDKEGNVFGSLTFVLPVHRADEDRVSELVRLTIAAAREIGQGMVAREQPNAETELAELALTGSLNRP